jgi:hypothetical protein
VPCLCPAFPAGRVGVALAQDVGGAAQDAVRSPAHARPGTLRCARRLDRQFDDVRRRRCNVAMVSPSPEDDRQRCALIVLDEAGR